MSRLETYLEKHPKLDDFYWKLYPSWKLRHPVRAVQAEIELRKWKPGMFYLDHGNPEKPMVLVDRVDDDLRGFCLVDGQEIWGCSIFHCGPEMITADEARRLAREEQKRRNCTTCNGTGFVDWAPGQIRHTDEDQQPCPDCPPREVYTE